MTMKTRIETKAEHFRLYQAGQYGTKLRSWRDLAELYDSGYEGPVVARYLEPDAGWTCYDLRTRDDAYAFVCESVNEGAVRSKFTFGEPAPDEELLIQGEVMWFGSGWYLRYSTEKTKMRTALRNSKHLQGFAVLAVLRDYLTPSSYEDLMALFDTYHEPVVEFGAYRRTLGEIPGRNTIIWEVRSTY